MAGEKLPEFHVDMQLRCPCGGGIGVDFENFAVFHEFPMCQKFESLEPNEFLRYVRHATTGIADN